MAAMERKTQFRELLHEHNVGVDEGEMKFIGIICKVFGLVVASADIVH